MNKKIVLVATVVLIIVVAVIIYFNQFPLTDLKVGTDTTIRVRYEIRGGLSFGTYGLTIDDSGKIIEDDSYWYSENAQRRTGEISREELEELAKFIRDKEFFSMQNEYDCDHLICGTDAAYRYITATVGWQTKTVKAYPGAETPPELKEIINKIESYREQLE